MNKWTEDQLSFYDSYIEMLNENLEITECMENIETNVKGFLVVDKLAGFTEGNSIAFIVHDIQFDIVQSFSDRNILFPRTDLIRRDQDRTLGGTI